MNKVLLIADTYYPDSRATIQIAQRMAEELAARGYVVEALPLHLESKKQITYSYEHNAVSILNFSEYKSSDTRQIIFSKQVNHFCYRIAVGLKRLMVKQPKYFGCKWNAFLKPQIKRIRTTIYERPMKNIALIEYTKAIKNCIMRSAPDLVISVALPFEIHHCVSKAIAGTQIKWIPTNFDPYAFDELLTKRERNRRRAHEYRVYKSATAVFMLTQFQPNYVQEALKAKIKFVELPNIRPIMPSPDSSSRYFDSNFINCAFIGNLYGVKRNPTFIFKLFEEIPNENIHLHLIGSLIDISEDDIAEYTARMKGRLHYLGRVGQQDAIDAMFEADVLVNVGHSTTNQCPSKVLDYMCTGKPILHISKVQDCSSLPYLRKYENWFQVDERNGLSDKIAKDVEEFILTSRKKQTVPFKQVRNNLPNCTIEKYVDIIEGCLQNSSL